MTEKDALGLVLDLASQNLLSERDCSGDSALLKEMERQQEAIEIVFDRYTRS